MTKTIIIICIITFSSCSTLFEYLHDEDSKKNLIVQQNLNELYCPASPHLNIIHDSPYSIEEFKSISKTLMAKYKFNFYELLYAYTIYQSIIRPSTTQLNSRLQFIVGSAKDQQYFDLNAHNKQSLKQIYYALKSKYQMRSHTKLISQLKKTLPYKFKVQKELHDYLSKKKKELLNSPEHKMYYRLNKALRVGESFFYDKNRLNTYLNANKLKLVPPPTFTMNLANQENFRLRCSFDPGLYQNSIYLQRAVNTPSNTFSLILNDHFFIAATTPPPTKYNKSPMIPFCFYSDQEKKISLMGFDTRAPSQILYNLINYDVFKAKNVTEHVQYINFPRHEVLQSPDRIILESKRSSYEQLNHFLNLNIPIYHSQSIGQVWTIYTNIKEATPLFISDNRNPMNQSCLEK